MKTNKTIFIKKAIISVSLILMIFATSANITKEKANAGLDYYFFITADPNSASDFGKNKNRYISSTIYFTGPETCGGPSYNFESKAKNAFEAYLEAEYDDCNYLRMHVIKFQMHSTSVLKTKQQTQEVMNNHIADEKKDGNTVIKTIFTYNCD